MYWEAFSKGTLDIPISMSMNFRIVWLLASRVEILDIVATINVQYEVKLAAAAADYRLWVGTDPESREWDNEVISTGT